jgi:hypothetical protein
MLKIIQESEQRVESANLKVKLRSLLSALWHNCFIIPSVGLLTCKFILENCSCQFKGVLK